jgi:hypothetical protein
MKIKQQVEECWVCVIFFTRLDLVSAILCRACMGVWGGFPGPPWGLQGGYSAPTWGLGGSSTNKLLFLEKHVALFFSFFMLPLSSSSLLGGF